MKFKVSIARWISAATLVAVVLGVMLLGNPSQAEAKKLLVLHVEIDGGTFDQLTSLHGGPFYVGGDIVDSPGGAKIGAFHCWGFFFDDGNLAVVSQEYELFNRGKIQVQGVENSGPRAVTGGTGDFVNVRGEAVSVDLSDLATGHFTASFSLLGAKS